MTDRRLISGLLAPFALLYVRGIGEASSRLPAAWPGRAGWGVLVALVALALVPGLVLSGRNFPSR